MMPAYDAICPCCKHAFETLCRISERDEIECPRCGSRAERQVSAPAVRDDPFSWHHENNGRGRYIGQLQRTVGSKKDPNAYCKSRQEIVQKAEKLGCTCDKSVY